MNLEDEEKPIAKVGENIKLRLMNIEEEEVHLGSVLCSSNNLCKCAAMIDCQLMILDCENIFCPGFKFIMHLHNAVEEVTLVKIHHLINKKTGEKIQGQTRFVKQDQVCMARLSIANQTVMAPFSEFPELGRFNLRANGKTVVVGKITTVLLPKSKTLQS